MMPSLLQTIFLILALFPLCRLQVSVRNNFNQQLITWMNSLFYLPTEGQLRIRKEYRMMSNQERNDFHRAILLLKQDRSVPPNKYDALASLHHLNTARGAHGGPNFLGWHRVYLILAENAMREKVPNVTIPYWDNSLDNNLQTPRLSILWSPLFMGSGTGRVTTGPFAGFTSPYGRLSRSVGQQRVLMTQANIANILTRRLISEISNPTATPTVNLEEMHNDVHVWVGQQMSRIESSSYDPIFWTHHAFIDCFWEEFRNNQRRRGVDPTRDFPRFVSDRNHRPLASLGLGRLLVIDGINDIFTRRVYRCQPRPQCRANSNDCGSPYLRCNWTTRQCVPLMMNVGPVVQLPWWMRNGQQAANTMPMFAG